MLKIHIPKEFREKLSETVVISYGQEKTVSIYTIGEWDAICVSLRSIGSLLNGKGMDFIEENISYSREELVDGGGNVYLEESFVSYANLSNPVSFKQCDGRLEISKNNPI